MKVYKITVKTGWYTTKDHLLVTDDPKKIYDHSDYWEIVNVEMIGDCEVLK